MKEFDPAIQLNLAIEKAATRLAPKIYIGRWLGPEDVDANLSQVQVSDVTFRFVPKVSSATPSVNDSVLMVGGRSTPVVIVGVVVGDITLADLGLESEV